MKKYVTRILIAVLAFSIGTAAIYLTVWDGIDALIFPKPTHSAENNSPYSVLNGTTITVKPYDATFAIPEIWLTPNPVPEPSKNLHLSWQDLNKVYRTTGSGMSDGEDADVMNAALSFKYCVAHFGDKGWGNWLWNDLQGRAYVVNMTAEEVGSRIEEQGLAKAVSVFEKASLISETYGDWQIRTYKILDAPTHFMLNKRLDFYYRPFDNKTVVFVFLHAGGFDPTIDQIVGSFRWPGFNERDTSKNEAVNRKSE